MKIQTILLPALLLCSCSMTNSLLGKKDKRTKTTNATEVDKEPERSASAEGPQRVPAVATTETAPRIGPLQDDGHAGIAHEKHAGKIVFSKNFIEKDIESDQSFLSSLTLRDKIFLRVFLAKSWENVMREQGISCYHRTEQPKRAIGVSINGAKEIVLDWKQTHENNFAQGTTYIPANAKKPLNAPATSFEKDQNTPYYGFASELVPALKVGENTLNFRAFGSCFVKGKGFKTATVAEGSLQLNVKSESARKKWLRRNGPRLPKASVRGLEKKLLNAMKKEQSWKSENLIAARPTSKWRPIRHKYSGRIIKRKIDALLVVKRKDESSSEGCRVFKMSFVKDAAGGPISRSGTGSSKPFPCSLAKR